MRKLLVKATGLLFLFVSLNQAANAQLGNLLKDLNNLKSQVEKAAQGQLPQQNTAPTPTSTAKNQSNNTGGVSRYPKINSSELCEKFKSSAELKEFSGFAKDISQRLGQRYSFDTADKMLAQWISEKNPANIKNARSADDRYAANDYLRTIEVAANDCVITLGQSDLLYLVASDHQGYLHLAKSIADFNQQNAPKSVRKIDANGNVVNESVIPTGGKKFFGIGAYNSGRLGESIDSIWFPFLVIAWDENGQLMKNIYPEIKNNIYSSIVAIDNERKEVQARQAQEKKAAAENQAKAESARLAEQKKIEAFVKSPDGQLTLAYQDFQVIQLCYDLQKDSMLRFIKDSQYQEYRSKIKRIEKQLDGKTAEKDHKKLWANAEYRNRHHKIIPGSDLEVDVFKVITDNARSSEWVKALKDCSSFAEDFRNISDDVLGQDAVKKSF